MDPTVFRRTKKEELSLDVIVVPSTKTVRELTHVVVDYLLVHSRASEVLQTDLAKLTELERALENSPDREYIAFITGIPGQSTMPPKGSPTNQQERWAILEGYRSYLEKVPESYEDHFFRSLYSTSAVLMMQDFIRLGITGVKGGDSGHTKYLSQLWQEASQREHPEEFARAWASRRSALATVAAAEIQPSRPPPGAIVIDEVKSTYELMDTILTTEKPPSPTVITMEAAERIQNSDAAQLQLMEFSVKVEDETFFWKVKSVEMSRRQIRFFWVQFYSIPDETLTDEEVSLLLEEDNVGSQIRVNESDFTGLLCRSESQ